MSTVLLQITSGRGPVECAWVVGQLAKSVITEARKAGLQAEILEMEDGPEGDTLLSALLHLSGSECNTFANSLLGTVQWIGYSTFRPGHKRKNWFVGIQQVPIPVTTPFTDRDVRIETMRGSGPGGQHVNTTESAVRAQHLPTGLVAISRDERSQYANRKRALERLAILVSRKSQSRHQAAQQQRWEGHNDLERGNPVRIYEGTDFRRRT